MQDAEYVVRFLTLHESWRWFAGSLSKSMDEFMLRHRYASEEEARELVAPFYDAVASVERIGGMLLSTVGTASAGGS